MLTFVMSKSVRCLNTKLTALLHLEINFYITTFVIVFNNQPLRHIGTQVVEHLKNADGENPHSNNVL